MDIPAIAQTIFGFVGIVAVGVLLRRFGALTAEDARPINNVIIYAGLPALIFRAVYPAHLDVSLAVVAAVAWAVFAISAGAGWGLSRLLRLPDAVAGGFILTAALGNTGYIGYPIAQALLGEEGLVQAVFYDVFGTVAALLLVGLFVAERMGEGHAPSVNPLKEALTFPAVIAVAVALLARVVPVAVPGVVSDGLDALANLVVPLIMVSVGLSLRPRSLRRHARELLAVSAVRLALAPVAAIAIASAVIADPQTARLVVLQAGMPSMMLSLVIGARFGLDTDFIASAILVTTVASVATIPLMQVIAG